MINKNHYFFDTYAVIEISEGNKNYLPYIDTSAVITKLNLFEIFYSFLSKQGIEMADIAFNKYKGVIVDVHDDVIREAALFRHQHKKRKVSMTDCVGYCTAKRLGIKFLTGDKEFIDMENVEFVQ
ncbi:PIN domain-containing protein [Candidatus Woesearchaeota archaeon]|nr:PIN domain-containing protein [Candidatus Woesearchaeota archaeon]